MCDMISVFELLPACSWERKLNDFAVPSPLMRRLNEQGVEVAEPSWTPLAPSLGVWFRWGSPASNVFQEEAAWFIKVVMFFGSISGVIISIPCGVFLTMYWDPWMPLGDGLLQQTGDGAGGNLTKFFFPDSIEHMVTLKARSIWGEYLENLFDATNGFFLHHQESWQNRDD